MRKVDTEAVEKILENEEQIHEDNQKRIKLGIKLVIIIPLVLMAIMFKMGSSKVVFLVLWIVSLFGISGYLIFVEYMDAQMQEKLKELGFKDEDAEIKNLFSDELIVEKVIENTVLPLLEEKIEPERAQAEIVEDEEPDEPAESAESGSELTAAQQELAESIRKYVETLGRQAQQQGGEVSHLDAQDYAAMRRARIAKRRGTQQGGETQES